MAMLDELDDKLMDSGFKPLTAKIDGQWAIWLTVRKDPGRAAIQVIAFQQDEDRLILWRGAVSEAYLTFHEQVGTMEFDPSPDWTYVSCKTVADAIREAMPELSALRRPALEVDRSWQNQLMYRPGMNSTLAGMGRL